MISGVRTAILLVIASAAVVSSASAEPLRLHIETGAGDVSAVERLTRRGARINPTDESWNTPLESAILYGNVAAISPMTTSVIDVLKRHGAVAETGDESTGAPKLEERLAGQVSVNQAASEFDSSCLAAPTRECLSREALNLLQEGGPLEFDPFTAELATAFFAAGQTDLMWEVLGPVTALPSQMQYSEFFAATLGDAYFTVAMTLPAELAKEVLDRSLNNVKAIRNDDARAVTLSFLAHAYAMAGNFDQARGALAEAVASLDESGIPGWLADPAEVWRVEVLVEIARKQLETGLIDEAIATLDELDSEEVPPLLFAEIAAARMIRGDIDQSDESFREALTAAETSFRGRDAVLSAMAAAQAKADQIEQAIATASEIGEPETQGYVLSVIASEQARKGDNDGASSTLALFFDVAIQIEDFEGAPFSRRGLMLTSVAEAYAKIGDIARAMTIAAEIESPYDRANALVDVAGAQLAAKLEDQARETIGRALATANEIGTARRNDPLLSRLAVVQAKASDVPGALATADRIGIAQQRAWTWIEVAGVLPE